MRWLACCALPHWQSMVVAPVASGSPACSHACRVMCPPCSPNWVTQPPMTCSTSFGSRPARAITDLWMLPSSSAGCSPASHPPRLPMALRVASTMTGLPMELLLCTLNVGFTVEHVPVRKQRERVLPPCTTFCLR
ncbi:Uncharacterised protein [Mycobacteroides abscessus subsp. abscessus]|nr:Uncharacterised protein [Mycobacteroides abscessus subsp. abscessus]